jgi:hypothetical protein
MAIKYKTQTGYSFINIKARQIRDVALKPKLTGMHCKKCATDSVFTFHQHQGYAGSGSVDWNLDACCEDFRQAIYQKLGVNS